jgi:2'-5' RNA ligase
MDVFSQLQNDYELEKYYKKIVDKHDFHLTLLFLGGWGEQNRVKLWERLNERLDSYPAVLLKFQQLDFFGKPKQPSVFYVKVSEDPDLSNLHAIVQEEAVALNFPLERRPFKPHVTLAKRWKVTTWNKPDDWQFSIKMNDVFVTADTVCLYRVHPHKQSMYEKLSTINLSDKDV